MLFIMGFNNKYPPKLYTPGGKDPFKLSRSKIDLFVECPRCFYLDRRLGVPRPSLPGFSLNNAVDHLLKKEFDLLRQKKQTHALMTKYGIDAIPYTHPDLEAWRDVFTGIQYLHPSTNLLLFGAIDDVWVNPESQLLVVDYKSTSTEKEISLDDQYKLGYKRQMEIYQWLFKMAGHAVADTGYFVFANATKNRPQFDAKLEFELSIIPYVGDPAWVEPTVFKIKDCLDSDTLPPPSDTCEYCVYARGRFKAISAIASPNK
jgi:hypothetical protein